MRSRHWGRGGGLMQCDWCPYTNRRLELDIQRAMATRGYEEKVAVHVPNGQCLHLDFQPP